MTTQTAPAKTDVVAPVSAGAVDVLAKHQRRAAFNGSPREADELCEARAALAELLAAAREVGAIECGPHVARLNIAVARVESRRHG